MRQILSNDYFLTRSWDVRRSSGARDGRLKGEYLLFEAARGDLCVTLFYLYASRKTVKVLGCDKCVSRPAEWIDYASPFGRSPFAKGRHKR